MVHYPPEVTVLSLSITCVRAFRQVQKKPLGTIAANTVNYAKEELKEGAEKAQEITGKTIEVAKHAKDTIKHAAGTHRF